MQEESVMNCLAQLLNSSVIVDIFMDTNRSIIRKDDRRLTHLTDSLKLFNEWKTEVNQQLSLFNPKKQGTTLTAAYLVSWRQNLYQ